MTVSHPWPTEVPTMALAGTLNEQPERNVIEFQPEVGEPMSRRRSARSTDMVSFETLMRFNEYDSLLFFYREILQDGVLAFRRASPRDDGGTLLTWRFTAEPRMRDVSLDICRVQLAMRRIP